MTTFERELAANTMKQKLRGIGVNEWSAEFNAMIKSASFYERFKRLGQEIHITGVLKEIKWRESYRVYQCILTIEYEVIE